MPRFPIRKESSPEDDGMLRGTISESDYTHITKVLRLGEGDRITVFDTESTEYEGIISGISLLKPSPWPGFTTPADCKPNRNWD